MTEAPPQTCDVLIVGAGINGAGLFRDLCAQGVSCVIVDKGDYSAGTSAAPSRLIHGGLKYLETGEFRLVAESTYERNLLLANAPHLVTPLPTLIPVKSWLRGIVAALRTFLGATTAPRERGALLVKIGLRLYDFYGAKARQMPTHRMIGRARARRDMPALTPDIVALGQYWDAAIANPERLVLELVQDGLADSPDARALNWTRVAARTGATVHLARDDGETRALRPRIVVNAAGPWIDGVNATLGIETALIGGTKGSHILLDHPALLEQLKGRMLYFEGDDGRILLVFPYLGRALVGSTDIPDADPDRAACTAAERDYFMAALRDLLPGLRFDPDQIVHAYAGVRPLPKSDGVAPGLISRDHSAPEAPAGGDRPFPVISLVGGKWTTFRAFAAEVTDTVLARLGRERLRATDTMAIGGGRDMPRDDAARAAWIRDVAARTGGEPARIATLLGRYGTTARRIAAAEGATPDLLPGEAGVSAAEIAWIAGHEDVRHLEDIVLRRTQLAVTGQASDGLLDAICAVAAATLGWDYARAAGELARTRAVLAERHGIAQ